MSINDVRARAREYGYTLKKSGLGTTPYFLLDDKKQIVSDPRGLDYRGLVAKLDAIYALNHPDEAKFLELARSKGFNPQVSHYTDGTVHIGLSWELSTSYANVTELDEAISYLESVDLTALKNIFPIHIFPAENLYTYNELRAAYPEDYEDDDEE